MRTDFILLLALAADTLAQTSSKAPALVRLCTSNDIANMDVSNCNCPSDFASPQTGCKTNPQTCTQSCQPPAGGSVTSRAKLNTCFAGCVDANNDCSGCYIWFHSLCGCLQRLQQKQKTDCITSSNITPGQKTPPVWVVNDGHDLITTTYLIPGILQLHEVPNFYAGFELGQNTLRNAGKRDTGTLALNPVASRSQEQIHIHICDNKSSKVRDVLDGLNRASYTSLASVDLTKVDKRFGTMECRVASAPDTNIDQGGDILKYLQNLDAKEGPGNCDQYQIGSGYMVDSKGYAWSCITTTRSAEEIFCHN